MLSVLLSFSTTTGRSERARSRNAVLTSVAKSYSLSEYCLYEHSSSLLRLWWDHLSRLNSQQ